MLVFDEKELEMREFEAIPSPTSNTYFHVTDQTTVYETLRLMDSIMESNNTGLELLVIRKGEPLDDRRYEVTIVRRIGKKRP